MSASVEEVLYAMADAGYFERSWTHWDKGAAWDVLRAALRAAEQAGWVLVPKEATREMQMKGNDWIGTDSLELACDGAIKTYAAMLSAAPSVLEEK